MIHPSYSELIEAINQNSEDNDNTMMLNSRYSLVLATSKRARQLIAGAEPMVRCTQGKKPLSIAIEELYEGQVQILEAEEEEEEALLPAAEETAEQEASDAEDAAEDLIFDETEEPSEEIKVEE